MNRLTVVVLSMAALMHGAHAAEKVLKITNRRDAFPVWEVYISPTGQSEWGKDQLGGKTIGAGQSHSWTIPWDGCYVDVMAKTFTGLTAETRSLNVCGGAEWVIYDVTPKSQVQPSGNATSNFSGKMVWRITDKCANTESIRFRFFTEDGKWRWPGGTEYWYTKKFGESYDQSISCPTGRTICYGAWQPSNGLSWGAGAEGTDMCPSCCYACDGKVHEMRLTCEE